MSKLKLSITLIVASTLIILAAFSSSLRAQSSAIDITAGLMIRNQLDLATAPIKDLLFNPKVNQRLESWLTNEKMNSYVVDCQFNLRPFIPSPRILGRVCYLLRQPAPRNQLAALVLQRFIMETAAALFELSNDPRYSELEQTTASQQFKMFQDPQSGLIKDFTVDINKCFAPALRLKYPANSSFDYSPFNMISQCIRNTFPKLNVQLPSGIKAAMPLFALNLAREYKNHPGHAINPAGWIGGNKVTYLTENDYSKQTEQALEAVHTIMNDKYPLAGRGSLEVMRKSNPTKIFTEAEGFLSVYNHPVWGQKSGIFNAILKGIDQAQETIFIDIFFLGGTMGASLSKHIIDLLEKNPKLKVLILRDNINHFGHEAEMRPVFNFLLAYSYNNPNRLVIGESFIEGRKSGLPPFLQDIVTDDFLKKSGIQSHLSLYGRAQSDHSKVIVIDAKLPTARAFVGSKNLTDSSGGFCYDDVVEITGPIAAVVQDDYYWDMFKSMTEKMYKTYPDYIPTLANLGWASGVKMSPTNSELDTSQLNTVVAEILRPFDMLNRNAEGQSQITEYLEYPTMGSAVVRTGYNNVDSTRSNAVDQVIQAILNADKNVFIRDQFLFDRNVVSALIRAKKAKPHLDIRSILEPLKVTNPRGLPNLLYLDDLYKVGIKTKFKVTSDNHTIAQEYHMKTVSVDGKFVISGSANKDHNTMGGSFREEQLDVFDPEAAGIHDAAFHKHWNSSEESSPEFTKFDFKVPNDLKALDGAPLTPADFIRIIKSLMNIMYDSSVY
jgi:phosphatidylserine/phosphatidylglycerophosphate/cardiolipin synthase-like enzyme